MLASSCTARPDFALCGWAAADDFGADSGTGVAREYGQNMHPVSKRFVPTFKSASTCCVYVNVQLGHLLLLFSGTALAAVQGVCTVCDGRSTDW
jgi:hypothetical protein